VNITCQPFSTSARPIADDRCDLPPPGPPAEQDQIGAVVDPAVAGIDRHHQRLGDRRHGVELEAVEGLAGKQLCLGKVAPGPTATAARKRAAGQPSLSAR
jgi:hypothetical protein